MATIQQRARERQFDQMMQDASNAVAYGGAPNIAKALNLYAEVQAALEGDYSDMAERYQESVAPFAEDMPLILEAAQLLLSRLQAADEKGANDEDFGAIYPRGLFGTYEPEEPEPEE